MAAMKCDCGYIHLKEVVLDNPGWLLFSGKASVRIKHVEARSYTFQNER